MVKKILLLLLFLPIYSVYAESISTGVLVIGGTASGTAAAIQSARSKVKTMLVEPGAWLGGEMTSGGNCILDGNRNLSTGIWGEFRKKVREFYLRTPGFDTTANAPLKFEPFTGAAILKKICDTVKNLTVHMNTAYVSAKQVGNGWEVVVTLNGKPVTIKAKAIVDATPTGDITAMAGQTFSTGFDSKKDTGESLAPDNALPIIEDVTWIVVVKEFEKNLIYYMPKPEGYDPSLYIDLKTKDIRKMLEAARLPNDKFMIKWPENTFAATADDLKPENREAFYKKMRQRALGLVFYIENELGFKNIGIDDHEFGSPDHLPYIPYIREYRRAKGLTRMTLSEIYTPYANTLYRTSVAVGDANFGQHYADPSAPKTNYPPLPPYTVPLGAIVAKDATNLVMTEKAMSTTHLVNASTFYPSVQMTIGQAAGATAAYCAFYAADGKTTKNIQVRVIQGELFDFKVMLYPYADVPATDKYYRSIQQITATGMLKEVQENKGGTVRILFKPDSTVSTGDIEPVLREIYTRAFIWFGKNKPAAQFTVGDLLSYISDYTLSEPKNLQNTLRQQWQDVYHFKQSFDPDRPVTRYEFAVLANKYLNPFAGNYDITGKLVN